MHVLVININGYKQVGTHYFIGMQSKAVGSVKTQTILPTSMLNSHDGFLYSVSRSAYTEQKSEQRFRYKVGWIISFYLVF